jgi:hypothetical protein
VASRTSDHDSADSEPTREIDLDIVEDTRTGIPVLRRLRDTDATAPSPIPALLAESMRRSSGIIVVDPTEAAAPAADVAAAPELPFDTLIRRAQACMEAGDLPGAVLAADQAVAERKRSSEPATLPTEASTLLSRIFSGYLGLLARVPVLAGPPARRAAGGGAPLDAQSTLLLARVDGKLTLEQVSKAAHIPALEGLRIATRLMHDGLLQIG